MEDHHHFKQSNNGSLLLPESFSSIQEERSPLMHHAQQKGSSLAEERALHLESGQILDELEQKPNKDVKRRIQSLDVFRGYLERAINLV